MEIVHLSDCMAQQNPFGVDARKLLASNNLIFVHLNLKPGDEILPHSGEGDTFFFVIEGSGVATMNGETMEVNSNTLVKSEKGNLHGWKNNTDSILRILGIKERE